MINNRRLFQTVKLFLFFTICAFLILIIHTYLQTRLQESNIKVTRLVHSTSPRESENTVIKNEAELNVEKQGKSTSKDVTNINLRNFDCLKFEKGLVTEKDVSDAQIKKGESIFFIETSCKSRLNGSINLSGRQACAVESAALNNPSREVVVLVAAPAPINVSSEAGKYLPALLGYKNIKIYSMNVERYVKDTPVEELWRSGRLYESDDSKWRVAHLSDVMRYTTLWKYGGIYMDMDMYTTHSFNNLFPSFSGLEDQYGIGCSILGMGTDQYIHEWLTDCLVHLNNSYRSDIWRWNGNGLLERCLEKICSSKDYADLNNYPSNRDKCQNKFEIYQTKYFYPVPWWDWEKYFNKDYKEEMIERLKESKAAHLTNIASWESPVKVGTHESAFEHMAQTYCPRVYSLLDDIL